MDEDIMDFIEVDENGKLVFPESVTSIVSEEFAYGDNVTSAEIPEGITKIENSAFRGCSNLTKVTIPDSATIIGFGVFSKCVSLSSIIVSDGNPNYKSIDNCCLDKTGEVLLFGCKNSKIPDGVTKIDFEAFYGCRGLTSITIPDSVKEIGEDAFLECSGLKSIKIPNGVTRIGIGAFYGCEGLTSVIIPDSVKEIGDEAFWECTGLTSIEIPACFVDRIQEISDFPDGFTAITIRITEKLPDNAKDVLRILDYCAPSLVTLKVPAGCGEAYRHHPDFEGKFKEIQEV